WPSSSLASNRSWIYPGSARSGFSTTSRSSNMPAGSSDDGGLPLSPHDHGPVLADPFPTVALLGRGADRGVPHRPRTGSGAPAPRAGTAPRRPGCGGVALGRLAVLRTGLQGADGAGEGPVQGGI